MSIATGIWRAGRIELQTPPPSDWSDGDEVTIVHSDNPAAADILGEGPEAAAAWLAYLEELDKSTCNSTFPDEFEQFLKQNKTEELAAWDEMWRRIDSVIP